MIKDLISVVVPCYNAEKYLDETIESLKCQTYKNFEVILIDDGSKDSTLEMIKRSCDQNKNFRYYSQENQGVSAARNKGIELAKGKYINFFDSDDTAAPTFLEDMFNNIIDYDSDYSVCRYKMVKEDYSFEKTKKLKKKGKIKIFEAGEESITQLYSSALFTYGPCNKLYKYDILKKMEGYPNCFSKDISYGEDLDFNFRYLLNANKKSVFEDKVLYYYRTRKGSEVHSKFKEKMLSVFIGHERNILLCKDKLPLSKIYIEGAKCISCIEMLFRAYSAKYNNKERIQQFFYDLNATLPSLKKSKKIQWYKRRLIPLAVPMLKMMFKKYLKKSKKIAK